MLLSMLDLMNACSVNWEFGWSKYALNGNQRRFRVEKGRKKMYKKKEKERIKQGGISLTL